MHLTQILGKTTREEETTQVEVMMPAEETMQVVGTTPEVGTMVVLAETMEEIPATATPGQIGPRTAATEMMVEGMMGVEEMMGVIGSRSS
jgi:hypothetical protein